MRKRANTPAKATLPESAKTRSSHDARPHTAACGCTVASARQQSVLHLYAHVAPHAHRLLTARIARGVVSFLATYEASDVGGDVPLPRCAERLGPTPEGSWIHCLHGDCEPAHLLSPSLPSLVA